MIQSSRSLNWVKLWIWISVLATAGGWVLSACGALNRTGYLLFFVVTATVLWINRKSLGWEPGPRGRTWMRWRHRFSRPLPMLFLILAALILAGAALYPPTNHTATTYRIPRVLHWLAEGAWHWIEAPNYRMNNRACGIEWLSAPLMLFTGSDRLLFLLNLIPFLLLPGLTYSLLTRLSVARRVAWNWMWLLPAGYCFILQGGSTGNDTYPTVYAIAMVDFALRARASGRSSDLWYSGLCAGLLIGAKASNLPLLLPWGLAFLWAWPKVKFRPLATPLMALVAALVSFIPTAVLNIHYCGDWSGLSLERAGMDMKSPIVGVWGNSLLFALHNYLPPFFPPAAWWNQNALTTLPGFLINPLVANFEQSFHYVWEMPTEDWVGLGFGVSVFLTFSVLAAALLRREGAPSARKAWIWILILAPWAALLAYCVKSGMVTGARLIAPYYPLLLPAVLIGAGQVVLVRRRWWRRLAALTLLASIPVLVVTPGRPLWPAQTVLGALVNKYPDQRLLARALRVYTVYNIRSDPLAPVREMIPAGVKIIGFLGTEDDPELSLWRPFGSRRVQHLLLDDDPARIRRRGIDYAVVGGFHLASQKVPLAVWLQRTGAKLEGTTRVTIKVAEGPQEWHLVRFQPAP